jgi:hypothetical protein
LPQWASFAKEEINILGIPEKIDFLDISLLATGEVPLVLTNERGELTVDPMTGIAMAGASVSDGRPLPWLDVPGFTPPQVQERAAEASAEMGIMTSLPAPSGNEQLAGPDAGAMAAAQDSSTSATAASLATSTTAGAFGTAEPAQPAQPAPPKAAEMPKDDDWDLPEGLDGNAFVPIEAE